MASQNTFFGLNSRIHRYSPEHMPLARLNSPLTFSLNRLNNILHTSPKGAMNVSLGKLSFHQVTLKSDQQNNSNQQTSTDVTSLMEVIKTKIHSVPCLVRGGKQL